MVPMNGGRRFTTAILPVARHPTRRDGSPDANLTG